MQLAFEIVDIFHGVAQAEAAEEHFRTVFQQRELPADMPEVALDRAGQPGRPPDRAKVWRRARAKRGGSSSRAASSWTASGWTTSV